MWETDEYRLLATHTYGKKKKRKSDEDERKPGDRSAKIESWRFGLCIAVSDCAPALLFISSASRGRICAVSPANDSFVHAVAFISSSCCSLTSPQRVFGLQRASGFEPSSWRARVTSMALLPSKDRTVSSEFQSAGRFLLPPFHARTRTRTRTRACMRAHATHARTCHARTHARTHVHTCTRTHARTHTCAHELMHVCAHAHAHARLSGCAAIARCGMQGR